MTDRMTLIGDVRFASELRLLAFPISEHSNTAIAAMIVKNTPQGPTFRLTKPIRAAQDKYRAMTGQ